MGSVGALTDLGMELLPDLSGAETNFFSAGLGAGYLSPYAWDYASFSLFCNVAGALLDR